MAVSPVGALTAGSECPKLEAMQTKQLSNIGHEDFVTHSPMDVCFSFF